jgi:broad specificity phosphatase PhoE
MYTLLSIVPTEKCLSSTVDSTLTSPSSTQILVVRHAHVHNPKDILYGRLPRFRLSESGRTQAEATARFLSTRPVTTVYTSPLLRARQTAEIIVSRHPHASLHTSRDLLETRTSYQGSPNSILKPGFSFYEPRVSESDETMEDVFERMVRFLTRVLKRHRGETVVAVSHADPITIMRVGLRGLALTARNLHAEVYPERASVTQLTYEPGQPPAMAYFNIANTLIQSRSA